MIVVNLLFLIISSVFIGLIIWWYYLYFKHKTFLSNYKGPSAIPIIGSVYRISSTKDIIPVLLEYHKQYGPVLKIWIGFRPRIVIGDYRIAELLLDSTKTLDKSYDYEFFEPWLGHGILTSTGTTWRNKRKLMHAAFNFQVLEQYIAIFRSHTDTLLEQLRKAVYTGPFDVYPYMNLYALDVICEAAMGFHLNAQTKHDLAYVNSVSVMTRIIFDRMFSIFQTFEKYFRFTPTFYEQKKAITILHGHSNQIINTKLKMVGSTKEIAEEDDLGRKRIMSFLDLLSQSRSAGADLTDETIREDVDAFMFAGHDTVTSALSFILLNLAEHTTVQDKVLEELRSVFNDDKNPAMTYNDLQDLKYLEMVIKESMRLYPPVPIFAREIRNYTEFDGVVIPKGTNLTVFTVALHRQEGVYADPEKFDPERFTMENASSRSPFSYVPFSAGSKNCVGQRFAMLSMKVSIAKILMNFKILPVPGFRPILLADAILRSHNGVMVQLKERIW